MQRGSLVRVRQTKFCSLPCSTNHACPSGACYGIVGSDSTHHCFQTCEDSSECAAGFGCASAGVYSTRGNHSTRICLPR